MAPSALAQPARRRVVPALAFAVLGARSSCASSSARSTSRPPSSAPRRRRRRRPTRSRRTCGSCTAAASARRSCAPRARSCGASASRTASSAPTCGRRCTSAPTPTPAATARGSRRELDRLQALGVANLRVMAASEGPDESDESVGAGLVDLALSVGSATPWRVLPAMQPSPGLYNDGVVAGLDFLLVELARRDMTAVLVLGNTWPFTGGFAQYVAGDGQGDPVPAARRGRQLGRLPAVRKGLLRQRRGARAARGARAVRGGPDECDQRRRVRRRPDDHGVGVMNEPRPMGSGALAFREWIGVTAALVCALAPRQLVAARLEGTTPLPQSYVGIDPRAEHAAATSRTRRSTRAWKLGPARGRARRRRRRRRRRDEPHGERDGGAGAEEGGGVRRAPPRDRRRPRHAARRRASARARRRRTRPLPALPDRDDRVRDRAAAAAEAATRPSSNRRGAPPAPREVVEATAQAARRSLRRCGRPAARVLGAAPRGLGG